MLSLSLESPVYVETLKDHKDDLGNLQFNEGLAAWKLQERHDKVAFAHRVLVKPSFDYYCRRATGYYPIEHIPPQDTVNDFMGAALEMYATIPEANAYPNIVMEAAMAQARKEAARKHRIRARAFLLSNFELSDAEIVSAHAYFIHIDGM